MVHKIERWDPSTMDAHPRILLIGRSGSGKSVALRDLLSYLAEGIDLCLLFSPTTESIEEFRKVAPPSCVHPGGLKLEVVEAALRMNRELGSNPAKRQRELFLVADDVSYDKQLLKSPAMRDIAMNGRHAKCGFAMTLQYCMDVGPDLRTQFQYIICCAENIHANRKRIWNYFAGVIPSEREFHAIMQSCTKDHCCLVIDNSNPSASIQNSVFWWKARLHPPPYKLCRPVFWQLDQQPRKQQNETNVLVVPDEPKQQRRARVDAI